MCSGSYHSCRVSQDLRWETKRMLAISFIIPPVNLPPTHQQSQSLQVPLECGPECWGHPVLVLRIAILTGRLLQRLQVTVSGGSGGEIFSCEL